MKKKHKYYGINFSFLDANCIGTKDMKQLAKLLLISPTTTVEEAYAFVNNPELCHVISKLIKTLDLEINEIKNDGNLTEKSIKAKKLTLILYKKIIQWQNIFSMPEVYELIEIGQFLGINNQPLWKRLIKLAKAKKMDSPYKIAAVLNKYIIGQEEAIKVISVLIHQHRVCVNSKKSIPFGGMLIIGKTGTGKTYTLNIANKILGLDYIRINCTNLAHFGIFGKTISTYLSHLYQKCNKNIERMKQSLIHFDEMDKITAYYHKGDNIFNTTIQHEILKFFDVNEEFFFPENEKQLANQLSIKTNNLLIVMSGAFTGIDDIIYKRLLLENDGHINLIDKENLLQYIKNIDIQNYGIIPELISRIAYIVPLRDLNKDDMYNILVKAKNSALRNHINKLSLSGIKLRLSEDALKFIADLAFSKNIGARSLQLILDEILVDYYFNSSEFRGKEIVITAKNIQMNILKKEHPKLFHAFEKNIDLVEVSKQLSISIDTVLDYYAYFVNNKR